MWLVFLFVLLFIGIIFSKLEINLSKIYFYEKDYNFNITLTLKLFFIIKAISIKLDKNKILLLGKRLNINKYKIRKIDKKIFDLIKDFKIKIKKIDFTCKIGVIDIGLTNFIVILFSTLFPIFVKDRVKRKNFKFEVLPEYNKLLLDFQGKFIISIKISRLIKLHFKNIKSRFEHNKNKKYEVKEIYENE